MEKYVKIVGTIVVIFLLFCLIEIIIIYNKANNIIEIRYNEGVVNKPILFDGMKAISFNEETGEPIILSESDAKEGIWYSYEVQETTTENGGTSKWANAMTADGSMWVWIPRYAYKIDWNKDDKYGNIDIIFLNGNTDYSMEGTNVIELGYKVHPAFKNGKNSNYSNGEWDKEITGIWVSKFEAGYSGQKNTSSEKIEVKNTSLKYNSKGSNVFGDTSEDTFITYPVFMGQCYSYNNLQIGEMYSLSLELNSDNNPYGFSSNTNTHMLKNSEWGAIAYLSHSKYGRNGTKVSINNMNITKAVKTATAVTGYAGNTVNALENIINNIDEPLKDSYDDKSYVWYTPKGGLGSTTGNVYGVYDLNGGCSEYVSGYLQSISSDSSFYYGKSLLENERSSKYCTIFNSKNKQDIYKSNKEVYGDATIETSQKGFGYTSWFEETSFYVSDNAGFFLRGGEYDRGFYSGVFCFTNHNGHSYESYGFRCALIEK